MKTKLLSVLSAAVLFGTCGFALAENRTVNKTPDTRCSKRDHLKMIRERRGMRLARKCNVRVASQVILAPRVTRRATNDLADQLRRLERGRRFILL